jgi:hypothetical protein
MPDTLYLTVNPSTMTPGPPGGSAYAGFEQFEPEGQPATSKAGGAYAGFEPFEPEMKPSGGPPTREIGPGEAAGRGALESITFGSYPAIAGIMGAGGLDKDVKARFENPHAELEALLKGLGRLGYEHLIAPALGIDVGGTKGLVTGDKTGPATQEYRKAREAALAEQQSAFEQQPAASIGGQVAGALATPGFGALKGVSALGKIGQAAKSGAISGGLYGAGTAIGEGKDASEIPLEAGKGAVTGGVLGGAGGALLQGAGNVASRVGNIFRGARDPEAEAARTILGTMTQDASAGGLGIDRPTYEAAQRSGLPITWMDVGGQATRDVGRAASDLSPAARGALDVATAGRIEDRQVRIRNVVHTAMGGRLDAPLEREALVEEARRFNGPRYAKAYAIGNRPISLDKSLMESPTVSSAMRAAETKWKDWQAIDGIGSKNPPAKPNLQFWDYAARELAGKAQEARDAGNMQEAARYGGLERLLKAELDKQIPEFKAARSGAAAFFNAENASEAGEKFILMNADPREARRALAAMNPAERELFARGFADKLAEGTMNQANTLGTIKKLFTTPRAREKIEIAVGPARAKEIEVAMRAETIAQRSRDALGNSQTNRFHEMTQALLRGGGHGIAGGGLGVGAVGAFETIKDQDWDPKALIGGALIVGGLKVAAHKVDTRVFRAIGEMLAADPAANPEMFRKGVRAVARSPQLFNALRNGTEVGARVAAHDIGFGRVAAGTAAALDYIMAEEEAHHHPQNDINPITQPGNQ